MPFINRKIFAFLICSVCFTTQLLGQVIAVEAPPIKEICILERSFNNVFYVVHPNKKIKAKKTADFQVDFVDSENSEGWPPQAMNAFNYAIGIWESHLQSNIPVRIQANWVPLEQNNTLASAGPTLIVQIEDGKPDTWYSIAHASALSGIDFVQELEGTANEVEYDIRVNVNANFDDWYFGTDAAPLAGRIDFVTVILHEIGHGIGFSGSMHAEVEEQIAGWGYGTPPTPIIYDRFTIDASSNQMINQSIYPNPSGQLLDALTGQNGGVFFNGDESIVANGGFAVPLYTPNEWTPGSSYSHLDQVTFTNSVNALMRPQVDFAYAIHSPGPLFCGMLKDMAWPLGEGCISLLSGLAESIIILEEEEIDFGVTNAQSTVEGNLVIANDTEAEDPLLGRVEMRSGDYFSLQDDVQYFNLEPGESTEIPVEFSPERVGISIGELEVHHNSPERESPVIISLTGEALKEGQIVRLDQNYPNPFSTITNISYAIPKTSSVRLDIFNILGKHMQNLVNAEQPAGNYTQILRGSALSSGMYFYRINVDGILKTEKFLLVK